MKYQEWLDEWMTSCIRPSVKTRTFEKYDLIIKKQILPQLGAYELKDLTASVLQKFTADLSDRYAVNTVSCVIAVMRSSLRRAAKTGVVERQLSDYIQTPKNREKKVESFTLEEQRKIEQYILNRK